MHRGLQLSSLLDSQATHPSRSSRGAEPGGRRWCGAPCCLAVLAVVAGGRFGSSARDKVPIKSTEALICAPLGPHLTTSSARKAQNRPGRRAVADLRLSAGCPRSAPQVHLAWSTPRDLRLKLYVSNVHTLRPGGTGTRTPSRPALCFFFSWSAPLPRLSSPTARPGSRDFRVTNGIFRIRAQAAFSNFQIPQMLSPSHSHTFRFPA